MSESRQEPYTPRDALVDLKELWKASPCQHMSSQQLSRYVYIHRLLKAVCERGSDIEVY